MLNEINTKVEFLALQDYMRVGLDEIVEIYANPNINFELKKYLGGIIEVIISDDLVSSDKLKSECPCGQGCENPAHEEFVARYPYAY